MIAQDIRPWAALGVFFALYAASATIYIADSLRGFRKAWSWFLAIYGGIVFVYLNVLIVIN